MSTPKPTHIDEQGRLHMVDVSGKAETARAAIARSRLCAPDAVVDAIFSGGLQKGEALAAARIAGISAAKRTGDLIPLCHPVPITWAEIRFSRAPDGVDVESEVRCAARTGVEMEALVAASVASLTLYDMAKAMDKSMTVESVRLIEKRGGKSGVWRREE